MKRLIITMQYGEISTILILSLGRRRRCCCKHLNDCETLSMREDASSHSDSVSICDSGSSCVHGASPSVTAISCSRIHPRLGGRTKAACVSYATLCVTLSTDGGVDERRPAVVAGIRLRNHSESSTSPAVFPVFFFFVGVRGASRLVSSVASELGSLSGPAP